MSTNRQRSGKKHRSLSQGQQLALYDAVRLGGHEKSNGRAVKVNGKTWMT